MHQRSQRTIERTAEVSGIGFLTDADIHLCFHPAAPQHGISFLRTDRSAASPIPALVEYTLPRQRRTAIECGGITVEMIEHVMAALAGLQIDNCLVTLDAPEPPGCDGSSQAFVEALLNAGIVDQGVPRRSLTIQHNVRARSTDQGQTIDAGPSLKNLLTLKYTLNYGIESPIVPQQFELDLTPEAFIQDVAFARTFVLETEAHALRAQGYGKRITARDLLIFGAQGPIDNSLRVANECARHKVLDCIGDLALIGCDMVGTIEASRSGHQLNAEIVRRLKLAHADELFPSAVQKSA